MELRDIIIGGLGMVISLAFAYIPKLNDWFYSLDKQYRGLFMVGVAVLVSLGVFGLSCAALFIYVPCTNEGAVELLRTFLILLGTNQLTYVVIPESAAKLRAKAKEKENG